MAVKQSAALQVQGLAKLLKKLDAPALKGETERVVLRELAIEGSVFLSRKLARQFPKTSASVGVRVRPQEVAITATMFPYIFFERGSQYPTTGKYAAAGSTKRSHRTRANLKRSALRIKPRRFLAATRGNVRKNLPAALDKAAKGIEKAWAA